MLERERERRMVWKEEYLDVVLVPSGLLIMLAYHLFLLYRCRKFPETTVIGYENHYRKAWIERILQVRKLLLSSLPQHDLAFSRCRASFRLLRLLLYREFHLWNIAFPKRPLWQPQFSQWAGSFPWSILNKLHWFLIVLRLLFGLSTICFYFLGETSINLFEFSSLL